MDNQRLAGSPRASGADGAFSRTALLDRAVIVTGAAKGIGLAIVEALVGAGARVGLLDLDPAVHAVAARYAAPSTVVDLVEVDATREAIDELLDALGGCWCLVNNAGVFAKTPLLEVDTEEFDRLMAVNVRSMVVTMQAVASSMIAAGGGRIINQASMAAKLGTEGELSYAASKAAVVALSRIAAKELGLHSITVNSVCPGYVLTDLGADTRDPQQVAAWTAQSPLGRLATPADIAALVVYLASDSAAYVTGQALNVTGGMCTW